MTEVKDKDKISDKSDIKKPFNIEERMGRVEGILDQVKERLNHVETEISGLRREMGDLRNHVDTGLSDLRNHVDTGMSDLRREMTANMGELRNHVDTGMSDLRDHVDTKMDRNLIWTIGIIITMWVTIILAILFKIP